MMNIKKIGLLILSVLILSVNSLRADEGMWMLPLIQKLNSKEMSEIGFKLSARDIYDINKSSLKDAILQFGGGCTAEIISKDGLILTNHHCGYGAIQKLSAVDHDYLQTGFWAKNREEELPAKGLTVTFLDRFEDVTKEVTEAMAAATDSKAKEEVLKTISDQRSANAVGESKYLKGRLMYASKYAGSSNGWKKWIGMNETFEKLKVYERRAAEEKAFSEWVTADPSRVEKFGNALGNVKSAIEDRAKLQFTLRYYMEALGSIELTSAAMRLSPKPGDENNEGRGGRSNYSANPSDFYKDYNVATDKKVAKAMIAFFKEKVPATDLPDFYETIE